MSIAGNTSVIEHQGIVQRTDNKSVTVKILVGSACSGCHAEGSCSLSGVKEKIVDITGYFEVSPGDNVIVVMQRSAGYTAVLLGYVFPLVFLLIILITLISSGTSELAAGLITLGMLIPYYFLIWLFRKRISNKFKFTLKG